MNWRTVSKTQNSKGIRNYLDYLGSNSTSKGLTEEIEKKKKKTNFGYIIGQGVHRWHPMQHLTHNTTLHGVDNKPWLEMTKQPGGFVHNQQGSDKTTKHSHSPFRFSPL